MLTLANGYAVKMEMGFHYLIIDEQCKILLIKTNPQYFLFLACT